MIFNPAGNNKFDRAVIKYIRSPRQDSSTPVEPKTSPDTIRPLEANASTTFSDRGHPGRKYQS
jgi:hypothetical protein